MHSYISYRKLASLYVCFAMLHTTLHNETEIIRQGFRNQRNQGQLVTQHLIEKHELYLEEESGQTEVETDEAERKIFDMIIPDLNEDVILWHKIAHYVTIPYSLSPSLSAVQQLAIPAVLRSIEEHTCIRFIADHRPCDDSDPDGCSTKLCFQIGRERAARLGRRPVGSQAVTLAPEDGPYWVLHLVGHVLGLPHPHPCLRGPLSSREQGANISRSACAPRHCSWQRVDASSAMRLTDEELSGQWSPYPSSAAALLSLWRTRHDARLSHWDLLALNGLYRCWEGRHRCLVARCRHGGFMDARCVCVCPPGFGGIDCGRRTNSGGGDAGCVRHLTVGTELTLTPSGLDGLGVAAAAAEDQCVLRVKTTSQKLRVLVRLGGSDGELSKMSDETRAQVYSEALLCTVRMYVFQNRSPLMRFCLLDYVGETLLLNVVENTIDLLFSADSSLISMSHTYMQQSRLAARSADNRLNNLTGNPSSPTTTPAATADAAGTTAAAVGEKGQARSAVGSVPYVDLIVLPTILFALMGFNILVVFCIKKYWEYRYGTAGIYRGTDGSYWDEQDEEEPEDWQVKVQYSESFEGEGHLEREMTREASVPQAEMTDLELFRSLYGVPGHTPPVITVEPSGPTPVPSILTQNTGNLTPVVTPSKIKKRVSFSDDMGKPLQVHSDAPLNHEEVKPSAPTPPSSVASPPEVVTAEEVHIVVPFSDNVQPPRIDGSGDSDSEEESEQSSCCDSSSSSSYHDDDEDKRKAESGLLREMTQCFRRKSDDESNEI